MDKFILDEKNYKKKIKLEKEKTERTDKIYVPKKKLEKETFVLMNKDMKKKYHFEKRKNLQNKLNRYQEE